MDSTGSIGVPHVKLLDFGLAKLSGHGEQPIVSRDGAHVTETDSLTARGTILGTFSEPTALREAQPAVPPALDRLVRKCLAKQPDEAPPSVQRGVRPLGRVNWPAVSPDGLRLAYVSNETGSNEVYVRRLPNLNDARRISRERGMAPVWSRDGRELFYVTASPRKMMAIGVPLEPGSAWGHPRVLFDVPGELHTGTNNVAAYDVSPDGQRFIFVRRPPAATPPPPSRINIVFNWFEELKAKVVRTGDRRQATGDRRQATGDRR